MTTLLETTSPDTIEQHAAEQIGRDGWTIVNGLIRPDTLAALRRTADGILRAQKRREQIEGAPENYGSRRARELLGRHEVFWECASHPVMTAIADRVLGRGFHIGAAALNEVNPGARAQRLHRDDDHVAVTRPFSRPAVMNTIWALNDFDLASGATRFVPGSHRAIAPVADDGLMHAVMPAGSVFIFDGSLWHGSSANTTATRRRVGLVLTYCAVYIRPFEYQLRGLSARQIDALPTERLRLVSPALDVKLNRRSEVAGQVYNAGTERALPQQSG